MVSLPTMIISNAEKRDQGHRAQLANIQAAKAVSEIIKTTLGPKSMIKMLLDPLGGITLTTDGNAVLREIDVAHPAAKSLVELSRAQDEEIGDGTTSVVLLAGEILSLSEQLLAKKLHPSQISIAFLKAYKEILVIMETLAVSIDPSNDEELLRAITTCIKTKFSSMWGELLPRLALEATKIIMVDTLSGGKDIEVKKFIKVEKIPGSEPNESKIVRGVMLNKDVTHPKMRRKILNPKIVLLDTPLEYKKGESQTNVEIADESHWEQLLLQEEEEVQEMCQHIIKSGCDVCVTEKGVSDIAQHFLVKQGISVIRRVKKSDNNRLARISGATIVSRASEIRSRDVGTLCDIFEVKKIGDEYYTCFINSQDPKACTVLLRGGSKDILNEVERNFHDTIYVARNLLKEPKILPGGGATEMEIVCRLASMDSEMKGSQQWALMTLASALEVIPRTLLQNCGGNIIRSMEELKSRHRAGKNQLIGVDGLNGEIVDVSEMGIWDAFATKQQIIKAAVEAAAMLLRIDDILSASQKKKSDEETPERP